MYVTAIKPFKLKSILVTSFKNDEDFGDATLSTGLLFLNIL